MGLAWFLLGLGIAYALTAFSVILWWADRPHRCARCGKKGL